MLKYSESETTIKVGITGGIGSGKTLICRIFKNLGIPVYEADSRARYLMESDKELIENIIHHFGDKVYEKRTLNRPYLANLVFNNKEKLNTLNSLVHPAVSRDFATWTREKYKAKYVLHEAAILFESGTYKKMDKSILIDAPDHIRVERVTKRDGVTEEKVVERMNNQWPTAKIRPLADYIVVNNNKQLILPQVIKIHNHLNSYL